MMMMEDGVVCVDWCVIDVVDDVWVNDVLLDDGVLGLGMKCVGVCEKCEMMVMWKKVMVIDEVNDG